MRSPTSPPLILPLFAAIRRASSFVSARLKIGFRFRRIWLRRQQRDYDNRTPSEPPMPMVRSSSHGMCSIISPLIRERSLIPRLGPTVHQHPLRAREMG